MSSRWPNLVVLLVFLLTVPAGVFFYFTSPGMGYPKSTAGIIAGVLRWSASPSCRWRSGGNHRGRLLGGRCPRRQVGVVLIGFLIVMAAVVAFA